MAILCTAWHKQICHAKRLQSVLSILIDVRVYILIIFDLLCAYQAEHERKLTFDSHKLHGRVWLLKSNSNIDVCAGSACLSLQSYDFLPMTKTCSCQVNNLNEKIKVPELKNCLLELFSSYGEVRMSMQHKTTTWENAWPHDSSGLSGTFRLGQ